jgi:hypothetical protein
MKSAVVPYVITKGKAYVAVSGSENSYTMKLQEARVFATREAAQAETCGNETVVER